MEANELRLGNWIFQNGIDYSHETPFVDKEDAQPIRVDLTVLAAIINFDGTRKYFTYDPIPLTPEILEKAGFEDISSDSQNIYAHGGFVLKNEGNYKSWIFHVNNQVVNYNSITGLHQLQNLYFALTGTELEVKLTTPA